MGLVQAEIEQADMAIARCKDKLAQLSHAMRRRRWAEAAELAESYAVEIVGLKARSDVPVAELMRLDLMHRRAMRWLSQQMLAISQDIESLDHGARQLHRNRDALSASYQKG